MNAIAFLIALAACANAFWLRHSTWRGLLGFAFLGVGVILSLFGGFNFWWDSHMQPGKKSAVLLVWVLCLVRAWAGQRWLVPWLGPRLRVDR